METYYVPAKAGESEFEEKRSTFLGHIRHVESEEEAKAFVEEMRAKYHDARHNCWCWILHTGEERYSDDGEPQGTAGIPMLEVFRHSEISDICCVVTRYFGGVLLGPGGLARAYTSAAKSALENAGLAKIVPLTRLRFQCPYGHLENIRKALSDLNGVEESVEYEERVRVVALLPQENAARFVEAVRNETSGGSEAVEEGTALRKTPMNIIF